MRVSDVDTSVLFNWVGIYFPTYQLVYIDQIYDIEVISRRNNIEDEHVPVIIYNVVPSKPPPRKFYISVSDYIIFSRELKINNLFDKLH